MCRNHRSKNDELLGQQLDRVITARAGQDSVTWTVFSVFAAAHAVLIAALVTRNEPFNGPETSVVISIWYPLRLAMASDSGAVD